MPMTLVSSTTLSVGAAEIQFSGIPQTGRDLVVLFSGRLSNTSLTVACSINGQTNNFDSRYLLGQANNGTTSAANDTNAWLGFTSVSSDSANAFGSMSIYLSRYTSSNNKLFSVEFGTENNASLAWNGITGGIRTDTAPITSFSLRATSGTFIQNSTASLYIIS